MRACTARGPSIIHKMCLRSHQANLAKFHITHDTENMLVTFVCTYALCIYFIPKNPCGIAITFEGRNLYDAKVRQI